jgi:membrane fusion protein, multidrug efflux system
MPSDAMKYFSRPTLFLVAGLLGGGFYLLNPDPADKNASSGANREIPVRVAQARRIPLPLKLKLAGTLLPVNQTEIVSRLAGKLTEVRFKVGDAVPAGAVVATILNNDLARRIARLEASAASAQHDLRTGDDALAEAENRLAKHRELLGRDLIARRDVEQSETVVETARAHSEFTRAQLAQQEAMLAQVRALQSLTRLRAPSSGEVGAVLIAPGADVSEGSAIVSLVNLGTLKLIAKVNDSALSGLRPGMKFQVSSPALPGIISVGEVIRLRPRQNGMEKTREVEIHVDNRQKKFRSGMYVEGAIDLDAEEDALLIPRSAVLSEDESHHIYKVSDGHAVRQQIVLGAPRGEEITVAQGVEAGDAIIVDLKMISPGTRVRVSDVRANRSHEP